MNPTALAEPPPAPKPNPQPPTAEQAARIVTESWRDPDWGTLVWTAMTTGVRRGELCGIRLSSIDVAEGRETVWLRKAVRRNPRAGWVEGDLKTHQQRRIALDAETVAVLREHVARCRARATALGFALSPEAFLFSGSPDGSRFLSPGQRDPALRPDGNPAGDRNHDPQAPHYSATELITAGVDPRTVAGRLGHGGGTTTLKTYTAWVSKADQRAARGIGATMPHWPAPLDAEAQRRAAPRYPYEVIAADLGRRIEEGSLAPEDDVPTAAILAVEHDVSLATAKRALVLAQEWGLLERLDRNTLRVVASER